VVGPGLSSSSANGNLQLVLPLPFSKPTHDLLDALPSREVAELLVKVYTDFRDTLAPSMQPFEGSVLTQFEALYDIEPKIDSYAVVAIIYLIFAIGLQFLPFEARGELGEDVFQMQTRCYGKAREAVGRSETAEPASLERISAILMLGVYLKTEGRPNDDFHLIGQAIRVAQSMVRIFVLFLHCSERESLNVVSKQGMHREGAKRWGIGTEEDTRRRKTWWILYVCFASLTPFFVFIGLNPCVCVAERG
jgi:hypothetical protein